jgi:hypothetical protein
VLLDETHFRDELLKRLLALGDGRRRFLTGLDHGEAGLGRIGQLREGGNLGRGNAPARCFDGQHFQPIIGH